MDLNNLKYISPQRHCISKKLHEERVYKDLNEDFILPDYISDIKKIIRFDSKPKFNGKYLNGEVLEYEGEVVYSILVISEDDKINNLVFSSEFENSINMGSINDENAVDLDVFTDSVNVRLANPRKVSAKCKLVTDVSVNGEVCISPTIEGNHTIEDEMTLEEYTDDIMAVNTKKIEEKDITFSEDIEIEASLPEINSIVYCDIVLYIYECKAIESKIMLRGDALIRVLYESVNGDYIGISKKFPISEIIENDDILKDCACIPKLSIGEIKATPQNNSYGESRIIELDFTWNVEIECAKNESIPFVRDVYSTEYENKNNYTEINVSSLNGVINTNFSVNETKARNEISAEDALDIIDASVKCNIDQIVNDEIRKKFVVTGEAEVSLLYNCNSENDNKYSGSVFKVPLKFECDSNLSSQDFSYTCNVEIINTKARIDSNNVYVDFEVGLNLMTMSNSVERLIDTVTFSRENKLNKQNKAPIVLYYPQNKEKLWDIAKRYNTTREAIKNANNITDTETINEKVLIIPHKKSPALFSKII